MATSLKLFLKANKKPVGNVKYAPTKSMVDTKGNPLEWTFKPITSDELNEIREECTKQVPVTGKYGQYTEKINSNKLNKMLIARCTVEPDLQNEELQDSYGVRNPEDLLTAMVDLPGEFTELLMFVNKVCGFDTSMEDKAGEAKN